MLPGAFEQAVADADTFFTVEMPMLAEWRFGPEKAAEIEKRGFYPAEGSRQPASQEGSSASAS